MNIEVILLQPVQNLCNLTKCRLPHI